MPDEVTYSGRGILGQGDVIRAADRVGAIDGDDFVLIDDLQAGGDVILFGQGVHERLAHDDVRAYLCLDDACLAQKEAAEMVHIGCVVQNQKVVGHHGIDKAARGVDIEARAGADFVNTNVRLGVIEAVKNVNSTLH